MCEPLLQTVLEKLKMLTMQYLLLKIDTETKPCRVLPGAIKDSYL